MFTNVAASMAEGTAAIAEVAQTGQAGTRSLLQSTQCCQFLFSLINYCLMYI
jgi:hypothetical protein